jgi:hypothetical protein
MSLILPYSTRVGFSGPGIRIAKSEVRISAVRRKPPGKPLHFRERSTGGEIVVAVEFPSEKRWMHRRLTPQS